MKKAVLSIAVIAAAIAMSSCGNKSNAPAANGNEASEKLAEAAVPNGFKTYEFANFSISVPEDFIPGEEQDYGGSTTVRFATEKMVKHDDGEEYSSSATIDCGYVADGSTPSQIKEVASTMKLSQEAAGETCDEPIIDGNTILMRHYIDSGKGYKVITWRWWILSDSGKSVAGNISYSDTEGKYYDGIAQQIVKTIKMK